MKGNTGAGCEAAGELFRVMAFAQLTCRESLRDIEVCLAAQAGKLYHMGIGEPVARSTLADAEVDMQRYSDDDGAGSRRDHNADIQIAGLRTLLLALSRQS